MTDFLTRSWRPVTMYVFLGLIVVAQLGVTGPVPEPVWPIVQFAMGGYVVGRSLEKAVESHSQGRQP